MEVVIMYIAVIPTLQLGLSESGAVTICLDLSLEVMPLSIEVYFFVEWWICIVWCKACASVFGKKVSVVGF